MIYFLIYLYRILILPFVSFFVNLKYFFYLNYKKRKALKVKMKKDIDKIQDIDSLDKFIFSGEFGYVQDLCKGFLNFIPTLLTFYVRKGGDCSCWARIIKKLAKKIGIDSSLYLLIDGWKIKTAHVVVILNLEKNFRMYNVVCSIDGYWEEELLNLFTKGPMVKIEGKPYKYNNLEVFKWF